MKLSCRSEFCPETGQKVEMTRCCGVHPSSKPCKYYGRKPWSEYMYVTCEHPHACKDHKGMTLDVDLDTLFCFYDVKKSPEVAKCCGVLAELLKAFWDDSWRTYEKECNGMQG